MEVAIRIIRAVVVDDNVDSLKIDDDNDARLERLEGSVASGTENTDTVKLILSHSSSTECSRFLGSSAYP